MLLAAIHNSELPDSPAQQVINVLSDAGVVDEVIEVYHQPVIQPLVPAQELSRWRRFQGSLEKRWRTYIGQANWWINMASRLSQISYDVRLRWSSEFHHEQSLARQIEKAVTAKHLLSWRSFVGSSHDFLYVVESDATITDRCVPATHALPTVIGANQAAYVNIAGGLNLKDLKLDHLMLKSVPGYIEFLRPVTNTSCAYVMNREFAQHILEFLDYSPESADLGIDWVINSFFVDACNSGFTIKCLHADPPTLIHGSIAGITRSWHPNR